MLPQARYCHSEVLLCIQLLSGMAAHPRSVADESLSRQGTAHVGQKFGLAATSVRNPSAVLYKAYHVAQTLPMSGAVHPMFATAAFRRGRSHSMRRTGLSKTSNPKYPQYLIPHTPNPKPRTLNHKPQTPNPKPNTPIP